MSEAGSIERCREVKMITDIYWAMRRLDRERVNYSPKVLDIRDITRLFYRASEQEIIRYMENAKKEAMESGLDLDKI